MEKLNCWICNLELASALDLMLHTIEKHNDEKGGNGCL